jgi:dihydrodipicolinate synthase/N-acetylneuraminate lyase
MLTSQDLHGVMAMMPAFATPDGADIRATDTVAVDNLRDAVDRMIRDGADVIATTGSFGEFHTLLWEEFETLTRATIEVVNKRVPLFLGCTALNSREVVRKMRLVRDAGGEGVLVGVPFYFPSTVDNAVQFYHDIAELFPDIGIMIYHNPPLHNVNIPVPAFRRITQSPNVVAMKDSHRTTSAFMNLMEIVRGKMALFPNQWQYYPYSELGAVGCWSTDVWLGPWPVLRLRDAIREGSKEEAQQIIREFSAGGEPLDPSWRETATKIAQGFAGYCDPGPLRPPFVKIPDSVIEGAKKRAAYWQTLCEKYRPQVEALARA